MTIDNFPDRPLRPGSPNPPATIDNVAFFMAQEGIISRYNEVKKKVELTIPDHKGTAENLDNVAMTHVISLCSKKGMPHGCVPEFVNAIADRNAYNPVADWIRSVPWDGKDRLPKICATVAAKADYPEDLKCTLLQKWLRSAVAAAIVPGYKGRGVLTFQGPQGAGKTSWVKALVSDRKLADSVVKLDHHMDTSNKDSILGAICHWIVEMGEVDSAFKKDVARLKGFITTDSDRIRRPYDRRESEYPRRTLFVATVNDPSFLVDTTGNSRWWTIAIEKLNFQHTIDMQQLYAQLAVEVGAGQTWWLNQAEEAALAEWNGRHVMASVVADAVHGWLDLETPRNHVWSTPSQVLKHAGITHPTNPQAKECGAILRELFGEPSRINGVYKWKVPYPEPRGRDLTDKTPRPCAPGEVF